MRWVSVDMQSVLFRWASPYDRSHSVYENYRGQRYLRRANLLPNGFGISPIPRPSIVVGYGYIDPRGLYGTVPNE